MSLEPGERLSAEDILQQAGSDIGSQRTALDKLPPTPDERFGGLFAKISKPLQGPLRSLKEWLNRKSTGQKPSQAEKLPSKSTDTHTAGPGWLGWGLAPFALAVGTSAKLVGRLFERLGASSFIDQMTRNREIDRLMHLLKNDPDQGLQFALPLGGSEQSRGIAAPSNRLAARNASFDLGRVGHGGPADYWDIPVDQQRQLIQQYRELALREMQLGRHRRAAFIYAELLNDLVSAAGALEAGLHYREAAVLYRDRLKRRQDAARCLERGGQLDESAELYIELGLFEQAAELYLRLDRRDEAEQLLRRWVAQLIVNDDLRNASRVLHDKLHDINETIAVLDGGWPRSSLAQWCLREQFVVLGRHSRHDEASQRIRNVGSNLPSHHLVKMVALTLSNVAGDYPDVTIRELASDQTRILVAAALPHAAPAEATELLANISRLAPEDRLLSRDCDRYVRALEARHGPKTLTKRKLCGIVALRSFMLSQKSSAHEAIQLSGTAAFLAGFGSDIVWKIAKSTGKMAYVAGFGNNTLVVQRIHWATPEVRNMRAFWGRVSQEGPILLEPFPGDQGDLLLHPQGSASIDKRRIPTLPDESRSMLLAGTPAWVQGATMAVAITANGYGWRLREDFGTLTLTCFSPDGKPLTCQDLAIPLDWSAVDRSAITMITTHNGVRIGVGHLLCRGPIATPSASGDLGAETSRTSFMPLSADIRFLIVNDDDRPHWLIALFETGGLLINDNDHDDRSIIADGVESPRAAFLGKETFVVTGVGRLQCYRIERARPQLIFEQAFEGTPIAVLKTHKLGEFAVFTEDGNVQIFRLEH